MLRPEESWLEHHPEYVSKEQAKEIDTIANAAQQWFIENWQDEIH